MESLYCLHCGKLVSPQQCDKASIMKSGFKFVEGVRYHVVLCKEAHRQ